jgi:hypothetical protein
MDAFEAFIGKKPHELATMCIEIARSMATSNAVQFRKN